VSKLDFFDLFADNMEHIMWVLCHFFWFGKDNPRITAIGCSIFFVWELDAVHFFPLKGCQQLIEWN
jgi:hypothetical protein